jgi:glycyl-tRNA synthetase (class II)
MSSTNKDSQRMEKIVSLCKRRGFIFQSSEIYGGLNGSWDYGPLGVELKRNVKDYWWRTMVHERDDVVGMDGAILTHPSVLKASGHIGGFSDPMVDCLITGKRFRADQIEPQSGWVFTFVGAADYASLQRLLKEQEAPERSAIWSRIDLAPHLRQLFNNWSFGYDEGARGGYIQLQGSTSDQIDAFKVLVKAGIFAAATVQRFSAMEIGGNPKGFTVSSNRGVNTAIKIGQEFYRRRGIPEPIVIISRIDRKEKSTDYNPENGSLLTPAREFNLMFKTRTGPVEEAANALMAAAPVARITEAADTSILVTSDSREQSALTAGTSMMPQSSSPPVVEDETSVAYLRPETAQSIFVQFKNILEVSRKKLPFGIAQIGKAFRNEINPRNFTFRSREFEQMELEYFCRPEQGMELLEYWKEERLNFYENIGIKRDRLHVKAVSDEERAFYSKGTYDIEYEFPFGLQELEGVAYRTDYDLSQHQKASGKPLEYFDEETKRKLIPHVVEPSAGVDRTVLALICEAYTEDQAPDEKGKMETRTVLRFHPRIAPIKCAVFPLLKNKEQLVAKAKEIVKLLRPHMYVFYDEAGAIGRRYRRQDEVGTPFGVTVDFDTLGENDALRETVTLRDRDSMKQERVAIKDLLSILTSRIR